MDDEWCIGTELLRNMCLDLDRYLKLHIIFHSLFLFSSLSSFSCIVHLFLRQMILSSVYSTVSRSLYSFQNLTNTSSRGDRPKRKINVATSTYIQHTSMIHSLFIFHLLINKSVLKKPCCVQAERLSAIIQTIRVVLGWWTQSRQTNDEEI